ncbi:DUF1904 family protein [Desertibacillus haloalkaliphilus]|uniref:DUF1904 family protein n=1 Tax=Desertibacillus haloalkaliphilus TaxID=1328930 RepID=UPI001C2698EA|nr:DUF1904 family protein [Desertibacillus haloalkaliphilus]MBU8905371.1 DUF1904 domain-containing protein [Desertibacillus haloalkaliphilus]
MPFVRFKGFDKDVVKSFAPMLAQRFAVIAHVPVEKVKIELLHIESITETPSSVEIMMFPREQGVYDALAEMIDKFVSDYGYQDTHIFFIQLSPHLYYKEGAPLQGGPLQDASYHNQCYQFNR